MCGRYVLALRPAQIRRMLEDTNMPVYEAMDDDTDVPGAPRQSYNFAPGYHGVVYRADVPDWGAGPQRRRNHENSDEHNDDEEAGAGENEDDNDEDGDEGAEIQRDDGKVGQDNNTMSNSAGTGDGDQGVHYKLQSMKWGLIPFWTKRNPDYGSMLKTINCRDDSLAQNGGMWATMKARKRCIVVAQGFYEWLKKEGVKDKIPHYIKRKDGMLMCMAGLWDVVQYDDDEYKNYTYTIITTSSNKQLSFLHDRMPVILENGSDDMRVWLDPKRHEWSNELQSLLQPWDGELEIYPVSKDVGKVGNNSPTFIIPLDSKENKNNIANFFAAPPKGGGGGGGGRVAGNKENTKYGDDVKMESKASQGSPVKMESQPEIDITAEEGFVAEDEHLDNEKKTAIEKEANSVAGSILGKRGASTGLAETSPPPSKKEKVDDRKSSSVKQTKSMSTIKGSAGGGGLDRPKISATRNGTKSPVKSKKPGTQKITKFFGNSA